MKIARQYGQKINGPAQIICAAVLMACSIAGCAQTPSTTEVNVDRVGFFFLGGQNVTRPATGIFGETEDQIRAYQIAVLTLMPATAKPKAPIIMLPGFGITADTYLETPDGRPGWAMNFVRRGHPVYVVEPSHTTRSGIDSGFYLKPNARGHTNQLFSWGATQVWQRWGLGPEYGVLFANSRFPAQYYDKVVSAFTAVEVDRIAGERNITYQAESNVVTLDKLLEVTGPAVLLAHSAAGVSVFEAAMRRPDLVRAVISVEPVGCPAQSGDRLGKIALLSIFADHMEVRPQMPMRRGECRRTVTKARERGAVADLYDLPAMGIEGNSHLMMFESNSADIASMILDWLDSYIDHKEQAR